jgi:hypothetical protein
LRNKLDVRILAVKTECSPNSQFKIKMPYQSVEPHASHESVGSVLPPKKTTMYDESGATELIKMLLADLQERLNMTDETLNTPILPLLDQRIEMEELSPESLQSFEETRKLYTEDNGHIVTIEEFVHNVQDWLHMSFDADDFEDAYYSVICNIYFEPFMWSLFNKHLPSAILVTNPKDALNNSESAGPRGTIVPMHIVNAKLGLALSSLGVRINGDGFLAIYAAMTAICRLTHSFTDADFKVLLDSIPVDLVNESPLHQLGLKLVSVITYEFADRPAGSTIVYRETLKAILGNSRWPYFQPYFQVIEKQS